MNSRSAESSWASSTKTRNGPACSMLTAPRYWSAVLLGRGKHAADVPVRMVVGEQRAPVRARSAGCAQVARGRVDRVDGVVRVGLAVAARVHPPLLPRRRHEL